MKFADKGEITSVTYKAHNQDMGLSPVIDIIKHDGSVHATGYMNHAVDGLYTFTFTTPQEDTYLVAKVQATLGTIVVGKPKVSKIFYYDENPASTRYEIRDPDSLQILQHGDMFAIGHDLYVITTSLDGDLQVIAGHREGATIMLPFRKENFPATPIGIIGEYNVLDKIQRDRR